MPATEHKSVFTPLWKLTGEDFNIIAQCGTKIQRRFSLIGMLVFAILVTSLISAFEFTDHLFHSRTLDVFVGMVWSFIVTNMYVLLLYTITPAILPTKGKGGKIRKKMRFDFNLSLILRMFIMVVLALITAQPLVEYVLGRGDNREFVAEIRYLLNKDFRAWIITLGVVFLFLLPILLKYNVRKLGGFYGRKAAIYKRIIKEDYEEFKKIYKKVLESRIRYYNERSWDNLMPLLDKLGKVDRGAYKKHYEEIKKGLVNEEIEKFEYWADPPYRTQLKPEKEEILPEGDLLGDIYAN